MVVVKYFMDRGSRFYQQDTLLVNDKIFQEDHFETIKVEKLNEKKLLFAVLDGMGGGEAGDFISYFVAENLLKIWKNILKEKPLDIKLYENAIRYLQKLTEKEFIENLSLDYAGTTLAGLVIDKKEKKALSFNVGDSRVYLLRNNNLFLLSKDHSLVQKLIDENLISEEDRIYHPQKHIITFGLGSAFKDVWQEGKEKIYFNLINIKENDVFFLSTDGIHDYILDKELEKYLKKEKQNLNGLILLIEKILKIGAPDNFSFIYVDNLKCSTKKDTIENI